MTGSRHVSRDAANRPSLAWLSALTMLVLLVHIPASSSAARDTVEPGAALLARRAHAVDTGTIQKTSGVITGETRAGPALHTDGRQLHHVCHYRGCAPGLLMRVRLFETLRRDSRCAFPVRRHSNGWDRTTATSRSVAGRECQRDVSNL